METSSRSMKRTATFDLSVAGSEAPASVGPTKLLEDCPDYWRVPGSIPGVGLTQKRPFINKEKKR